MTVKFEIVSEYKEKDINLPQRATSGSAGYDIEAAENIIIPSIFREIHKYGFAVLDLENVKNKIKKSKLRVMVPTGLKVELDEDMYLAIHPRSGIASNCLLLLANQTGIIDSDYYNNPDNEGHIFIPLINISPFDIQIKKGDKIAQGIISYYHKTDIEESYHTIIHRLGGFGSTDK